MIEKVNDIGNVDEIDSDNGLGCDNVKRVVMGEVNGDHKLENTLGDSCKGKVMSVNEVVGKHTRPECGEDMKIEKCKMVYVAKVTVGGQR